MLRLPTPVTTPSPSTTSARRCRAPVSVTIGGTDKPAVFTLKKEEPERATSLPISAKISAMFSKQIEQREAHQRKKMTLFSRFGFAMLLVLCLILCLNAVATAFFIHWGIPTTSDASGDLIIKGSNGTVAQVALQRHRRA